MKLCTVCGVVTSRPGSRCTVHARLSNRSRHNALYNTREWQRLSARVLRAWRGQHGNWCLGYQRDAHPASDLTVDHVVPESITILGQPFAVRLVPRGELPRDGDMATSDLRRQLIRIVDDHGPTQEPAHG